VHPSVVAIAKAWRAACGKRPEFKRWTTLRERDKDELLHEVAARADDDTTPGGAYLTAYKQAPICKVFEHGDESVEHVVPRSSVHGGAGGDAEDDPVGWIEAVTSLNRKRSNYPLVLWKIAHRPYVLDNTTVRIEGEKHFVPPVAQRARLARKWLFIRATYPDDVDPPSAGQRAHAEQIVALAKKHLPSTAEMQVHRIHRTTMGWGNPLLDEHAVRWYDDPAWRALVFGGLEA
jgi:hypothetical protein